ncbi:MAG TPA: alpha/beta hydrolase [Anaerolineaceae bacterium]|nr:alpha/beta hydrolase [Anaerolineaceae bacterium]
MINSWVVEERVALLPTIGKLVAKSLPKPDLAEEKISFGPDFQQVMLLVWPTLPELRRRSAVLFLHGGGWYSGNPLLYRFVGHFFAGLGYPTLLGGYRLAPNNKFPTQMDDVYSGLKAGLLALGDNGINVEQLIVGGQSAGAQLAALLVYDRYHAARMSALQGKLIAGFYSISGPLSFADCNQPELLNMILDLMGDGVDWKAADPIQFIKGDEKVPALLIHGDRDPLVDMANTRAFANRLGESHSSQVELFVVHGGHHADLAALFVNELPITQVLEKWLAHCD